MMTTLTRGRRSPRKLRTLVLVPVADPVLRAESASLPEQQQQVLVLHPMLEPGAQACTLRTLLASATATS